MNNLVDLLSDGWKVEICAAGCPPSGCVQGHLKKDSLVYVDTEGDGSKVEARVNMPFCASLVISKDDYCYEEILDGVRGVETCIRVIYEQIRRRGGDAR